MASCIETSAPEHRPRLPTAILIATRLQRGSSISSTTRLSRLLQRRSSISITTALSGLLHRRSSISIATILHRGSSISITTSFGSLLHPIASPANQDKVAPGSVNVQFDASNPLLTRASLVWRFVLDWVGGRGVWAVMHSPLVTCRAKPR